MIRLNRFIASCTEYSRRQADAFITRGQITVNGRKITKLATEVEIDDEVRLDGKLLVPHSLVYYLLNKPIGYVCSRSDAHAEHLVTELVPANPPVFPVGRLDRDSRGLILLTNDGTIANRLTHPRYHKEKEYEVVLDKDLKQCDLSKLQRGFKLPDGEGKFDICRKIKKGNNCYQVIIHQGKNRQIRRMFNAVGYQVKDLKRVRIAGIRLFDLSEGEYRRLRAGDIKKLI
jgi:23S rRNA pseudouridine2605 synthase